MAIRAAIYVRISQDRGGAGLGVARQEEDCRALCARKGWDVVDVYPDNDVSAYSGAPRPKWQELLEDINEGDEGEALFGVDRLLVDPDTGTRALHRVLIPFTTADQAEQLAAAPDTEPEQIYAILTAAGHKLTWHETVSARMPLPDERSTLDTPDATPILHTTRVTLGTDDHPLLLEELRTNADRAQLAYRITADTSRRINAVRD
ncbi:recombinase family protein [Streptomyces demainii]|uniref:Resolvase/invertase-type recombinase catalytic domain-containing protein n=1 Tax=Streptomyces demainii TaxID=588122 RepID=A0ABT9KY86_9ACTN|nr:recombinase family protein [Streptomyces demainii]MDP9613100.1 hypothetical protein [Streptomyces demainii]